MAKSGKSSGGTKRPPPANKGKSLSTSTKSSTGKKYYG
jgi:hypothetical protein